MKNKKIVTGIDVGTTKIAVIIAETSISLVINLSKQTNDSILDPIQANLILKINPQNYLYHMLVLLYFNLLMMVIKKTL